MIDETQLVNGCKKGDNKSRKRLYDEYAGHLMTLCVRYIGNRENAEDVLHDGFINIFKSIDRFTYRGEGSLKAWMCKIMVNEALSFIRKNNSIKETCDENIPDMIDEKEDINEIPSNVLMDMIASLPAGYRMVFNLFAIEEKSHKEIGRLLGITEHTSSSQYYRAKTLLIKKIEEYRKKQ